jgi:hypothetical protein
MARTVSTTCPPPSIFTAAAPPSLTKRPALATASETETLKDMNGMSPMTMARWAARETARVITIISSIPTPSVSG